MVKILNENCKDFGLKFEMFRKTTNLYGTIWAAAVSDNEDEFIREVDVPSDIQSHDEVVEWAKEFADDYGGNGEQRFEIHF